MLYFILHLGINVASAVSISLEIAWNISGFSSLRYLGLFLCGYIVMYERYVKLDCFLIQGFII